MKSLRSIDWASSRFNTVRPAGSRPWVWVVVVVLAAVTPSCTSAGVGATNAVHDGGALADSEPRAAATPAVAVAHEPVGATPSSSDANRAPLSENAKIVFLHHSTGGVVWEGGVEPSLTSYNRANGTAYTIEDRAYPTDPYPWNNYPYDFYNIWVAHGGAASFEGQSTLEVLTQAYDVIIFKHCFPVSEIEPDTGNPDINSNVRSRENYVLQYDALKAKLRDFPRTRFVLWTGAALLSAHTNEEQAQRANAFFRWVVETWDEPGDNVFIWDFRRLETNNGLYLALDNAGAPDDSHPNSAFARRVAPLLVRRVVGVIQGRGDTEPLVGEE